MREVSESAERRIPIGHVRKSRLSPRRTRYLKNDSSANRKERMDRKEVNLRERAFHLSGERIWTLNGLLLFVFSAFSAVY